MPRGRKKNIQDFDSEAIQFTMADNQYQRRRMKEMGYEPAQGVGLDGRPLANASDTIEDEESLGSRPAKRKGRPRKVEIDQAKAELGQKLQAKKAAEDVAAEPEQAAEEAAGEPEKAAGVEETAREIIRGAQEMLAETVPETVPESWKDLDGLYLMTEIAEAIGTTRKVLHGVIHAAGIKPTQVWRGYGYYTAEQAKALKKAYDCQYKRDKAAHVAALKAVLN